MNPKISTRYGMIEGERTQGGTISRFLGIPFAKPPVGGLRWKAPERPDPWSGVRMAKRPGAACIQVRSPAGSILDGNEDAMSEDCLYLNVYTAGADPLERRPVILWLHYGGFMGGWSNAPIYDGSALAEAGAVVVTANYRVNRFGFLAHPALTAESAHHSSGNYGLLDQIAALEWVQENIAAFGGDPDCVTLYGVSAGSCSTSLHMTSPLTRGLFHRAIGGSGAAFAPPADGIGGIGDTLQCLDAAERAGFELMAALGARTADELRALPAAQVLAAKVFDPTHTRPGVLDTSYPIVDGYVVPSDAASIFASGRYNDVPLITGSAKDEGACFLFNADTETYVADNQRTLGPFADRFAELYPIGNAEVTMRSAMAANADRVFSWQNWSWARAQSRHGRNPVYYYEFAHEPPVPKNSVLEQTITPHLGAFHAGEIPYIFKNLAVRDWPWSTTDHALSDTMSAYWLDFARTGNPNGGDRAVWDSFDEQRGSMMRFDRGAQPSTARGNERFAFWDEVYGAKRHEHAG